VDATRRRFFANASHELRTPVTVLLGEAQLALRAPGSEREALERIAASGGYLSRRLDDLMRLARSEDGQIALRMGEADVARAVRAAVATARSFATASEIALDFPEPASADWRVTGDGEAITQAALALIDNAIKFTPPGGSVIVRCEQGRCEAGFSVADTGPGFEGDAEALFDAYAQESGGRAAGGAGLGLSIVRWIAEAHGGRVEAGRAEEGGALVRVMLPAPPGRRPEPPGSGDEG
jgi:signal transduction histidine kinase